MEKVCSRCGNTKDTEEFANNKEGKYGKSSWCKQCFYEYRRTGKGSYEYRKEYFREYAKEYRKLVKNKEYERRFREKYLVSLNGTASKLLSSAKGRANKKGLKFDLDLDWVREKLTGMVCEATGCTLELEKREDNQHSPFRPSIDRIDNNKGYTKGNSRIVCVLYNKAKSDCTDEDVMIMAINLVNKNS